MSREFEFIKISETKHLLQLTAMNQSLGIAGSLVLAYFCLPFGSFLFPRDNIDNSKINDALKWSISGFRWSMQNTTCYLSEGFLRFRIQRMGSCNLDPFGSESSSQNYVRERVKATKMWLGPPWQSGVNFQSGYVAPVKFLKRVQVPLALFGKTTPRKNPLIQGNFEFSMQNNTAGIEMLFGATVEKPILI